MRAIEEMGWTKEKFRKLYEEQGGFNKEFNKNHPEHAEGETFLSFVSSGSEKLIRDHKDLVVNIVDDIVED